MRSSRATALGALLALGVLLLPRGAPPAWAAPETPRVALRTLTLSRVEGVLTALDAETLTLESPDAAGPRVFRLDEAIELEFAGTLPAARDGPRFRVHLVGGTRLEGRYAGPAEDGFWLETACLGRLRLPFEQVLDLQAWPADAEPCRDVTRGRPRPASGDAAYDASDDEFHGTVLEATEKDLVLETERGRTRRIAWGDLRLAYLQNDALKPVEGLEAEVETTDGARLAAARLSLADGALQVALRESPSTPRTLPFAALRSVRWAGGRFVYATRLPFTSVHRPDYEDPEGVSDPADYESFQGTRVDRRPSGCPLRVGGETFRHGFAVHAHNTLTFPLEGAYASFRCSLGIDEEVFEESPDMPGRGEVDARVLADGKVLWEAKGVAGGDKVRRVGPLDVRGVKVLVLEVGTGSERGLFSLDRADWGDPILVKK